MKRPRMSRSKIAAAGILVGCALQFISSTKDDHRLKRYDYSQIDRVEDAGNGRQRLLLLPGDDDKRFGQASIVKQDGLTLSLHAPAGRTLPAVDPWGEDASRIYKFSGEARDIERNVTWYNVLSSPRFRWNMAPHNWESCPQGGKVFLNDLSFAFHEPDPNDPSQIKRSKHLRFRVQKTDERDCLWNWSKTCLGGGNFLMNFGTTAKAIVHPGKYSLKTLDGGLIRIVAYNTGRDCAIKMDGMAPDVPDSPEDLTKRRLDYLRQAGSNRVNPEGCAAWIQEREAKDDLFKFNSDMATVHVDTPWMQIIIQLQQNKVSTPDTCVHASLNVWITNLDQEFLEEDLEGVLGKRQVIHQSPPALPSSDDSIRRLSTSNMKADSHKVDGPFD